MTSEHPCEAKRRHWPRFKLSTILVLVGIYAWMMAMPPWVSIKSDSNVMTDDTVGVGIEFWWHNKETVIPEIDRRIEATVYFCLGSSPVMHELDFKAGPRQVVWPMIAGIAFLT